MPIVDDDDDDDDDDVACAYQSLYEQLLVTSISQLSRRLHTHTASMYAASLAVLLLVTSEYYVLSTQNYLNYNEGNLSWVRHFLHFLRPFA